MCWLFSFRTNLFAHLHLLFIYMISFFFYYSFIYFLIFFLNSIYLFIHLFYFIFCLKKFVRKVNWNFLLVCFSLTAFFNFSNGLCFFVHPLPFAFSCHVQLLFIWFISFYFFTWHKLGILIAVICKEKGSCITAQSLQNEKLAPSLYFPPFFKIHWDYSYSLLGKHEKNVCAHYDLDFSKFVILLFWKGFSGFFWVPVIQIGPEYVPFNLIKISFIYKYFSFAKFFQIYITIFPH